MSKPSPQEVYRHLCCRLRQRIEFAEAISQSNAPKWQIVETISLQGRKAIETIAHMCLVATEHSCGQLGIPSDAKKHWNAEVIFGRLKRKGINILPSPSQMLESADRRFKAVFAEVSERRLSYDNLIDIYRMFHEGLHDVNPYRAIDTSDYFEALLPDMIAAITRIRLFSWVHYIGIKGQGFAVDLKNTAGVTAVVPLSKIGELPFGIDS